MNRSPHQHRPCTDPTPTATWLEHHLQNDPDLVALLLSAAETNWTPVVEFVDWALSRGLLDNVRTPHTCRRAS